MMVAARKKERKNEKKILEQLYDMVNVYLSFSSMHTPSKAKLLEKFCVQLKLKCHLTKALCML
jgi:hypothetical protein